MIDRDERRLAEWLADGPTRGPEEGLARALAATRAVRQRPGWAAELSSPTPSSALDRSLPMPVWVTVVLALLLLALVAAVIAGSRADLPSPFGLAGNGSLGYSSGGVIYLESPGGVPRPLPQHGGSNLNPTFSRDGTHVAFWSQRVVDGPLTLWVSTVDGSNPIRITPDDFVVANPGFAPAWTPAGDRLFFTSTISGVEQIWVVPSDGTGQPVAVTQPDADRRGFDLSPDARWLAYVRHSLGSPVIEEVVIARADGSDEHVVYSHRLPSDGGWILGPVWSPDSSMIAYTRLTYISEEPQHFGRVILAVARPGGAEHLIYEHRTSNLISWPSWSPDGRYIAFGTGDNVPSGTIELISPEGGGTRQVYVGTGQGGLDCGVLWAPDATAVIGMCPPHPVVSIDSTKPPPELHIPDGIVGAGWQRVARSGPWP